MPEPTRIRHLIDSDDWSLTEIDQLWALTRLLRDGKKVKGVDNCFSPRKTVAVSFSHTSTRSRQTLPKAIVEMGGVATWLGDGFCIRG